MTTSAGFSNIGLFAAVLCALLFLYNLPGHAQSVILTPPAMYNNPVDTTAIQTPREDRAGVVLTINEPAYVDMPIWASIRFLGKAANMQQDVHYPFSANPVFMKNHTFEVKHNGKLLSPRKPLVNSEFASSAHAIDGSFAPPTAPGGRLPLHLCYRFDEPGVYSVRYVLLLKTDPQAAPTTLASDWVTVMVQPYSDKERQQWQQMQLAHPPTDAGLLLGDYLPSLLASPNATVLPAFLAALHHADALVNSYAMQSLAYFDDKVGTHVLFTEIQQHGPSLPLVRLLNSQRMLSESMKTRLATILIPYLADTDPGKAEGALSALSLLQGHVTRVLMRRITTAVLAAMPHLLTLDSATKRTLADYLGGVKSTQSRKVLWQLTDDPGARNQALRSLCKIGDQRDVRRLGEEMRKSQRSL